MSLQLDWSLETASARPRRPRGRATLTVVDAVELSPAPSADRPRLAPLVAARPHRPRALHRRSGGRGFPFVLGAGAVSSIGDGMAFVAFPLIATTLTRNPALIAGVAVASRLPWLVTALPAGVLADRVDRRRLLAAIEIGRMVVLLALGLSIASHRVDLLQLFVAAFLLGAFETGFEATSQAVLPDVVAADGLARANGRLFAAQMAGEQLVGPAVGGVVFAAAAALPFVADGLSFAASAALLALALPRRRTATARSMPRRSMHADVREGLDWLVRHPVLRLVALLVAAFAFCQTMGLAVLVVFGRSVLHLSGGAFGLFVAAAAVGNIGGGLLADRVVARFRTGAVLVAAGLAGGAAYLVVGSSSGLGLALAAFILEAGAVGIGNVATLALRQSLIPSHLAGRVNASLRMTISGAAALGAAAGGVLASAGSVHAPFVAGGLLQVGAGLAIGIPLARRLAGPRPAGDTIDAADDVDGVDGQCGEPALALVDEVA